MKFEAVSPGDTYGGNRLGTRKRSGGFLKVALGSKPQLPMHSAPGEGSGLGLAQEPKIFVIKTPVVTTGSEILNSGPILHEPRSLIRVATGINTHKHVKGLKPHLNRANFFGFV